MKKPLNEEFKRMQKLAGLINEVSINPKGELEDFDFENDLVVEYTPEYLRNIKDYKHFYREKGLADDFETINGKKVKEITGYSKLLNLPDNERWIFTLPDPESEINKYLNNDTSSNSDVFSNYDDEDDDEDDDDINDEFNHDDWVVIGYIYSKSGKDIETEYDEEELWDAFYDSLEA